MGSVALHRVAGTVDGLDAHRREALAELLEVRRSHVHRLAAEHEQRRRGDPGDVVPQRGEVEPRPLAGVLGVEVVAPAPRAVLATDGVVAHAACGRFGGASWRGDDGGRDHLVEGVVGRRARDQRHRAALLDGHLAARVVHLGGHVDDQRPTDELGPDRRQADERGPAERHADDHVGVRRDPGDDLSDRVGVAPRAVVAIGPPTGVTVAGKVDGDRRSAEQCEHAVPRVGVLATAVQEDGLRRAGTPDEHAQLIAVGGLDGAPLDGDRAGPGNTELDGRVGDQRHLVVRLRRRHRSWVRPGRSGARWSRRRGRPTPPGRVGRCVELRGRR